MLLSIVCTFMTTEISFINIAKGSLDPLSLVLHKSEVVGGLVEETGTTWVDIISASATCA